MKYCPSTLIVTDNRDVANYVLRITPGASTALQAGRRRSLCFAYAMEDFKSGRGPV